MCWDNPSMQDQHSSFPQDDQILAAFPRPSSSGFSRGPSADSLLTVPISQAFLRGELPPGSEELASDAVDTTAFSSASLNSHPGLSESHWTDQWQSAATPVFNPWPGYETMDEHHTFPQQVHGQGMLDYLVAFNQERSATSGGSHQPAGADTCQGRAPARLEEPVASFNHPLPPVPPFHGSSFGGQQPWYGLGDPAGMQLNPAAGGDTSVPVRASGMFSAARLLRSASPLPGRRRVARLAPPPISWGLHGASFGGGRRSAGRNSDGGRLEEGGAADAAAPRGAGKVQGQEEAVGTAGSQ